MESKCFFDIDPLSHFPIQNLPYGVFSTKSDPSPRPGVAIGDKILDLRAAADAGLFSSATHFSPTTDCFSHSTLNAFMSLGKPAWLEARLIITHLLSTPHSPFIDNPYLSSKCLVNMSDATMHLPAHIGDYTDFFSSKEHATNCGLMFRGEANALNPNWLHLPVGYHGRASSIVVSGTNVRRPWGQVVTPSSGLNSTSSSQPSPTFQPSAVVDYELEIGCFIGGPPNPQGHPIPLSQATDHIFGLVLMNDWSARDIQRWESTPLGPFNSKNWATSISPWIVTPFALEPFQCPAPIQNPPPLPYLSEEYHHTDNNNNNNNNRKRYNYDINLTATLFPSSAAAADNNNNNNKTSKTKGTLLTRTNLKDLYWTLPQMITHHTSGGCPMMPGDMIATGTVSIAGEKGQGCMLELSWSGSRSIQLDDDDGEGGGGERTFLEDGDCLVLTGYCDKKKKDDDDDGDDGGYRLGFGECRGVLLPALER